MKFTQQFQDSILKMLLVDENAFRYIIANVKSSDFENEYQYVILSLIKKLFNKHEEIPTVDVIKNEIMLGYDGQRQEDFLDYLDKILNSELIDKKYLYDRVEEWLKKVRFTKQYESLPELYQSKNISEVIQNTIIELEKIQQIALQENNQFDWDKFEELMHQENDNAKYYGLGISPLDAELNGGLRGGDVFCWLAPTNVGKSMFLIKNACNMIEEKIKTSNKPCKIIHVNLEGRKQTPIRRYVACLSGVTNRELRRPEMLSQLQQQNVQKAKQILKDSVYFYHNTDFNYDVNSLLALLNDKVKQLGTEVIIIDYATLISGVSGLDVRHQITDIYRKLTRFAVANNVVIVTAAQSQRKKEVENDPNYYLDVGNVAECNEIANVCSLLGSINQTERENQEQKCRIQLCKNRDGKKGIKVGCLMDLDHTNPYKMLYDPMTGRPIC